LTEVYDGESYLLHSCDVKARLNLPLIHTTQPIFGFTSCGEHSALCCGEDTIFEFLGTKPNGDYANEGESQIIHELFF